MRRPFLVAVRTASACITFSAPVADQAEGRDLIGHLLLHRIEDTDRFAARYPGLMLVGFCLLIVLESMLEKVFA